MKNAFEDDHDLIKKNIDYWYKVAPKGATHYYPEENLWLQCSESGGWFSHWFQNGWRKMSFAVWLDIKKNVIKKPIEKRPYAQPEAGRKNVYLDKDTLKRLQDIGNGNVSAGIRIAVKAYKG